jgi:hypothetical protein
MTGTMFGRLGHRMSAEEAVTVRQLADLTGFPVRRIVRLINRTPLTQIRFAVAVTLANGEWRMGLAGRRNRPVEQGRDEAAGEAATLCGQSDRGRTMHRSFLPERTYNEAAAARQLTGLTGLPVARHPPGGPFQILARPVRDGRLFGDRSPGLV